MPTLVILIILSLSFYAYFKIRFFRAKEVMYRNWVSAKSSIALGVFIVAFALNQMIVEPSKVSIIVGIVFLAVGGGSVWAGIKSYRFYLPRVAEEAQNKN
ncbi:YtpI family protein [Bacillus pinisoli]|uniref:YtpI family protein n=1 Tax=Bacillus pinisoli TaxID=2901866 RepID=UPI001FF6AE56|nr:YtpI family protein [Bacillus pinisoli]